MTYIIGVKSTINPYIFKIKNKEETYKRKNMS